MRALAPPSQLAPTRVAGTTVSDLDRQADQTVRRLVAEGARMVTSPPLTAREAAAYLIGKSRGIELDSIDKLETLIREKRGL